MRQCSISAPPSGTGSECPAPRAIGAVLAQTPSPCPSWSSHNANAVKFWQALHGQPVSKRPPWHP
eukprot:7652466-Karenia_brevis.AAC.1